MPPPLRALRKHASTDRHAGSARRAIIVYFAWKHPFSPSSTGDHHLVDRLSLCRERGIRMTIDQEPIDSPQGWVADHVKRYIETNGEDGHLWRGAPTLILTTLG